MFLAELEEAEPVLPSLALGLPPSPPPAPADFRGVAIHWLGSKLPTEKPGLEFAPIVPVSTWGWMGVDFSVLSPERADRAPATTVEREAYVRHAAAIVMNQQALSSQATLLWEVRDLRRGSAALRVRALGRVTAPNIESGVVAFRVAMWSVQRLLKSGVAAFRVATGSWVPTPVPLKRETVAFRGRLSNVEVTYSPSRTGTVAFKAISWGGWPLTLARGTAAFRVGTGSWVPTASATKRETVTFRGHPRYEMASLSTARTGGASVRLSLRSQGATVPNAKTGTASFRVRQR